MRVLFLCTLNAVRSPMALTIAKELGTSHEFFSAGVTEGPQDYIAIEVMNEIDLDISKHEPKSIEKLQNKDFDLVICLAKEAEPEAAKFAGKCEVENWDIPSPADVHGSRIMRLFGYREIRDKLKQKIRLRFA